MLKLITYFLKIYFLNYEQRSSIILGVLCIAHCLCLGYKVTSLTNSRGFFSRKKHNDVNDNAQGYGSTL